MIKIKCKKKFFLIELKSRETLRRKSFIRKIQFFSRFCLDKKFTKDFLSICTSHVLTVSSTELLHIHIYEKKFMQKTITHSVSFSHLTFQYKYKEKFRHTTMFNLIKNLQNLIDFQTNSSSEDSR